MFFRKIVLSAIVALGTWTVATTQDAKTPEPSKTMLIGLKRHSFVPGTIAPAAADKTASAEKKSATTTPAAKVDTKAVPGDTAAVVNPSTDTAAASTSGNKTDSQIKSQAAVSSTSDAMAATPADDGKSTSAKLELSFFRLDDEIKKNIPAEHHNRYMTGAMSRFGALLNNTPEGKVDIEINQVTGDKQSANAQTLVCSLDSVTFQQLAQNTGGQAFGGNTHKFTLLLSKDQVKTLLEQSEKAGTSAKWTISMNNLPVPIYESGTNPPPDPISHEMTTLYTEPELHTDMLKDLLKNNEESGWMEDNWLLITFAAVFIIAVAIGLGYLFTKSRNS